MAQDDPDFKHLHNDENCPPTSSKPTESHHHTPLPLTDKTNLQENSSFTTTKSTSKSNKVSESSLEAVLKMTDDQELTPVTMCGENMTPVCGTCGGNTNGGRWDKSLGVLCQKFVMLFLVTPVSTCTCTCMSCNAVHYLSSMCTCIFAVCTCMCMHGYIVGSDKCSKV